jgi:hypothetical protein
MRAYTPRPISTTPRRATLVVIEFGGTWPRWLGPTSRDDVAVVAQHYEGEPISLIAQVASRVTRLEGAGWQLNEMMLVANGRTDPDAAATRAVLARGMLSRLSVHGGGRLALTTNDPLGTRPCRQLVALAVSLSSPSFAKVQISVRSGSGIPIYGPPPELKLADAS